MCSRIHYQCLFIFIFSSHKLIPLYSFYCLFIFVCVACPLSLIYLGQARSLRELSQASCPTRYPFGFACHIRNHILTKCVLTEHSYSTNLLFIRKGRLKLVAAQHTCVLCQLMLVLADAVLSLISKSYDQCMMSLTEFLILCACIYMCTVRPQYVQGYYWYRHPLEQNMTGHHVCEKLIGLSYCMWPRLAKMEAKNQKQSDLPITWQIQRT